MNQTSQAVKILLTIEELALKISLSFKDFLIMGNSLRPEWSSKTLCQLIVI